MFERFTDRARRVVVLAQEEARLLNHNYIGTEHILLGLLNEGEGIAAKALESLGINLLRVREQVVEIIGQGQQRPPATSLSRRGPRRFSSSVLREALQLGTTTSAPSTSCSGLIREGEGVAAQVLQKLGAELQKVRQTVIQLLSGRQAQRSSHPPRSVAGSSRSRVSGPVRRAPPCSISSAATSPRRLATASSIR